MVRKINFPDDELVSVRMFYTSSPKPRIDFQININFRFWFSHQALSPDDFRKVMKVVESAILSTDLAMYFKKRNQFLELVEGGEFDWQSEEKKEGNVFNSFFNHDNCQGRWNVLQGKRG